VFLQAAERQWRREVRLPRQYHRAQSDLVRFWRRRLEEKKRKEIERKEEALVNDL
jgi:hypothetical protein